MRDYEKLAWGNAIEETITLKSSKIKPIAISLLKMEENQALEVPLQRLLQSLIHMMVNRLFRSKQRLYELILYDTLERYYSSVKARRRFVSAN